MIKVLIVGSAPYIVPWWKQHGREMGQRSAVCPINCAWAVVGTASIHRWFRSTDFFDVAKMQPSALERGRMLDIEQCLEEPFDYDRDVTPDNHGSGTMLLNVLYHWLNHFHIKKVVEPLIGVIGADLIYSGATTHWYAGGESDPLRYGEGWLLRELAATRKLIDTLSTSIVNLSTHKTRLPFEHMTPEDFLNYERSTSRDASGCI